MRKVELPIQLAISIVMGFLIGTLTGETCHAFLVDDFSVDQIGFTTDQNAAYDTLTESGFLGGMRELWGGGSSIGGGCVNSDCSTYISGGRMNILPGADCALAGNVRWARVDNGEPLTPWDLNLDLSEYSGIEVEIADLKGQVETLFTIATRELSGQLKFEQLKLQFDSPGRHIAKFSEFSSPFNWMVNLADLDYINISTFVEVGEFVAVDSVSIIPEPSSFLLAALAIARLEERRR